MSNKLLPLAAIFLTGCSVFPDDVGGLGWQSLSPPEENALGRYLYKTRTGIIQTGKTLGGEGFIINDDNVRSSRSYDDVSAEKYSSYQIDASAKIQDVTTSAGIEVVSSVSTKSLGFSVVSIRDFSGGVPLEKEFIYKCLMLSNYSFEARSKTKANIAIDISKLAEKFGVGEAKINVAKNPEKPDVLKISVTNPNLCMAYISAKLFRSYYPARSNGKVRTFIRSLGGNQSSDFILTNVDTSEALQPDLGAIPTDSIPKYTLRLIKTGVSSKLWIQKYSREKPALEFIEIKESTPGIWDVEQGVENLYYGDNMYALVTAHIKASTLADGSIHIRTATLRAPTYKLILR